MLGGASGRIRLRLGTLRSADLGLRPLASGISALSFGAGRCGLLHFRVALHLRSGAGITKASERITQAVSAWRLHVVCLTVSAFRVLGFGV